MKRICLRPVERKYKKGRIKNKAYSQLLEIDPIQEIIAEDHMRWLRRIPFPKG